VVAALTLSLRLDQSILVGYYSVALQIYVNHLEGYDDLMEEWGHSANSEKMATFQEMLLLVKTAVSSTTPPAATSFWTVLAQEHLWRY
jgi:hypothetical protein